MTRATRSIVWLNNDYVVVYDHAPSLNTGLFKRFNLSLVTNYGREAASRIQATGRPVIWVETRDKNLLSGVHARDYELEMDGGFDREGRCVGLRVDIVGNCGCDGTNRAPGAGQLLVGAFNFTATTRCRSTKRMFWAWSRTRRLTVRIAATARI